ncbi:hypothetical protein NUU61_001615 [Penicillium alfredii]|uniref:Uncharacterized protein n=1 Tax=Penicillium alfredii TaxID=1506179 RepID=A0A9W9G1Q3_9EURO|nr:uncharacterized protein NUU61_001615 [Penicillium alfredii]KAJ5110358.1 hypothetical protein NUU61_001615 [Penicillium alfredii]
MMMERIERTKTGKNTTCDEKALEPFARRICELISQRNEDAATQADIREKPCPDLPTNQTDDYKTKEPTPAPVRTTERNPFPGDPPSAEVSPEKLTWSIPYHTEVSPTPTLPYKDTPAGESKELSAVNDIQQSSGTGKRTRDNSTMSPEVEIRPAKQQRIKEEPVTDSEDTLSSDDTEELFDVLC